MAVQNAGGTSSGVYTVYPDGQPLTVYCDHKEDNGGWLVSAPTRMHEARTQSCTQDRTSTPTHGTRAGNGYDSGGEVTNTKPVQNVVVF